MPQKDANIGDTIVAVSLVVDVVIINDIVVIVIVIRKYMNMKKDDTKAMVCKELYVWYDMARRRYGVKAHHRCVCI